MYARPVGYSLVGAGFLAAALLRLARVAGSGKEGVEVQGSLSVGAAGVAHALSAGARALFALLGSARCMWSHGTYVHAPRGSIDTGAMRRKPPTKSVFVAVWRADRTREIRSVSTPKASGALAAI